MNTDKYYENVIINKYTNNLLLHIPLKFPYFCPSGWNNVHDCARFTKQPPSFHRISSRSQRTISPEIFQIPQMPPPRKSPPGPLPLHAPARSLSASLRSSRGCSCTRGHLIATNGLFESCAARDRKVRARDSNDSPHLPPPSSALHRIMPVSPFYACVCVQRGTNTRTCARARARELARERSGTAAAASLIMGKWRNKRTSRRGNSARSSRQIDFHTPSFALAFSTRGLCARASVLYPLQQPPRADRARLLHALAERARALTRAISILSRRAGAKMEAAGKKGIFLLPPRRWGWNSRVRKSLCK